MKYRNSSWLWFGMLCISGGATSLGQQHNTAPAPGVSRPSSDQSAVGPGRAGTTYLRATQTVDQRAFASTMAARVQFSTPSGPGPTHIVSPTSDVSNIAQGDFVGQLGFSVAPQTISLNALKAYTTYRILRQNVARPAAPNALPSGESPNSMREAYGVPPGGGTGVIAIVDAFQYPQADADLQTFSTIFHLPPCRENKSDERTGCLQKYPQNVAGQEVVTGIPINCGWVGEAALDLQWAHAIAPGAKLIFVQAKSENFNDLFAAVSIAVKAVKAAGGGQISMSWIGQEYPDEVNDKTFETGVLYFASSGDTGGELGYPAASPSVISVGGTGLLRDLTGHLVTEYGWNGSGGGMSAYEPSPRYQAGVENIQGAHRNVPDLAADADPKTGAAVYMSTPSDTCVDRPSPDQYQTGWQVIGGTSLATPIVAAITNVAGRHRTSVAAELAAIYGNRKGTMRIRDISIMSGTAGGNPIRSGYDNVTGVGAPAGVEFDASPAVGRSDPATTHHTQ